MALLIGELEQTIDAKHRLAIGSMFRDRINPREDGEEFILVLGPDRHLWLYPDRYYARMLATVRRTPLPTRQQGKTRMFFGMARPLKPDAQGRVVLPEISLQRAVISDRVTLVGCDDHIEIWPADEWGRLVQDGLSGYGEMLYETAERMAAEQGAREVRAPQTPGSPEIV